MDLVEPVGVVSFEQSVELVCKLPGCSVEMHLSAWTIEHFSVNFELSKRPSDRAVRNPQFPRQLFRRPLSRLSLQKREYLIARVGRRVGRVGEGCYGYADQVKSPKNKSLLAFDLLSRTGSETYRKMSHEDLLSMNATSPNASG